MNEDKDITIPMSPYRGIHPFRYVDNTYFFGREQVVNSLYAKVIINRFVLLFGESGTGKTSVINAGLIPALEKGGFRPERIRVRPFEEDPILIERIHAGRDKPEIFLPSIFAGQNQNDEEIIQCSLKGFLDSVYQKAEDAMPVLIFDQFEELFTLHGQTSKAVAVRQNMQEQIFNTVFEIVNKQSLKAKVLVIIREDFLGKLDLLSKKYPMIFGNRVRLGHLDQQNAIQAVVGPFTDENAFPSRIDSELAERIVQEIAEADSEGKIQLTQLQIVCSRLWEVYATKTNSIGEKEFAKEGRVAGIIGGFLESQLAEFPKYEQDIAIRLLDYLITDQNTRDIVGQERLVRDVTSEDRKLHGTAAAGKEPDDPIELELTEIAVSVLEQLQYQRLINRTLQKGAYYCEVASEFLISGIRELANQRLVKEKVEEEITTSSSRLYREMAQRIRERIVYELPPLFNENDWMARSYWFLVTVAEAYFGLQRYEEARPWLRKAAALPDVPPWEFETTARQLADIVRMRPGKKQSDGEIEAAPAWHVLRSFLGDRAQGLRTAFLGKVGIALSGGGFRASLFHIGVLAKLAEYDMLRHVEVISCVSGGSIVGTYYYLELRKKLQTKTDQEITREDYIEIIQNICTHFLNGVQHNIRTRVAAEFMTNLKIIFLPGYSRSQRVGELYEEILYRRIDDNGGFTPRWLNDLFIQPIDEDERFTPKYDNWRRLAKVPILILNATTLNTGHNWQFTASWMGEPPSGIDTDTKGNYRLRWMYYPDAPTPYNNIRLGHAVAASACYPGLFEPMPFPHLYSRDGKDITVRLVDGEVSDSLGIMSLLEQDCKNIIVSDAGSEMDTQDDPGRGVFSVFLRSNNILRSGARGFGYRELNARVSSSLLRNLMFIHLKKDLDVDPVDWIGSPDPSDHSDGEHLHHGYSSLTRYGILKEIQESVANIRTDFDSYSDMEAFALMVTGYRMVESDFDRQFSNFPKYTGGRENWPFLQIEDAVSQPANAQGLIKLLRVGHQRAIKLLQLNMPLKISAWIFTIITLALFLWICWKWSSLALITLGTVGSAAAALIFGGIFAKTVMRVPNYRVVIADLAYGIYMVLFGWLLARIHLHVFDPLYLRKGRFTETKQL